MWGKVDRLSNTTYPESPILLHYGICLKIFGVKVLCEIVVVAVPLIVTVARFRWWWSLTTA